VNAKVTFFGETGNGERQQTGLFYNFKLPVKNLTF